MDIIQVLIDELDQVMMDLSHASMGDYLSVSEVHDRLLDLRLLLMPEAAN